MYRWATVMTSTGYLPGLLPKPMADHIRCTLAGHAQPPGLYTPRQLSVYMTAYLSIRMCLNSWQTVSGPIGSLDLQQLTISSSRLLACILSWTLVPVVIRPCSPIHTTPWGLHHPSLLLLSEPRCSLACLSVWHPSEKTHGIWLARWIHRDPRPDSPIPPRHTPATPWHGHHHRAYARRHMPLVPWWRWVEGWHSSESRYNRLVS